MKECKHGLKHGCAYCHAPARSAPVVPPPGKRAPRGSRLSEQMNDRMTKLKKRLKQLRGE
jgi:hypothetical protein